MPRIITDARGREYKLRTPSGHTNRGAPGVIRCANPFANDDGYGPEGLTCSWCANCVGYAYGRTIYKCKLFETHGPSSDIRAGDPACKKFTPDPTLPPVAHGWERAKRMTPEPCRSWTPEPRDHCDSTDRAGDALYSSFCPACSPPRVQTYAGRPVKRAVKEERALRRHRAQVELEQMRQAQRTRVLKAEKQRAEKESVPCV